MRSMRRPARDLRRALRRPVRPVGHRAGSAPSLTPHVAVDNVGFHPGLVEPPPDLFGHGDTAVLSARTADSDREVALSLAQIAGCQDAQNVRIALKELLRFRVREDVLA